MSGLELWSARKKGNELRTERSPKWEEELGSGEDDGEVREARKCGTKPKASKGASIVVDTLEQI